MGNVGELNGRVSKDGTTVLVNGAKGLTLERNGQKSQYPLENTPVQSLEWN